MLFQNTACVVSRTRAFISVTEEENSEGAENKFKDTLENRITTDASVAANMKKKKNFIKGQSLMIGVPKRNRRNDAV